VLALADAPPPALIIALVFVDGALEGGGPREGEVERGGGHEAARAVA
jgi:hypothetical protein